ncbi:MAG: HAD family hydrolase [Bryobacteraceae bacterium]
MLIIFDLDGTLIDSSKDLAISMNATREHLGLPPLDPSLIYSYVGNGAGVLVRRAMGLNTSDETVEKALDFFLKFYRTHALEHTQLYPGVREVVEELFGAGHKQAILTNKPVRISYDIVRALGLQSYFMQVYGGDSFPYKKPDPTGAVQLIREAGVTPFEALLVGDSGVDVQTARNAGVRSWGVTWGFQPEAFEVDLPDLLIHDPRQLLEQLNFLTCSAS